MVQLQILHAQLLRQTAGIRHGGVALFVGLEHVRLTVQAERLVQQPCAAPNIPLLAGVIRLVPAAGEPSPLPHLHGKAKLFILFRANVKKRDRPIQNRPLLAVLHGHQMQAPVYELRLLGLQQLSGHVPQQRYDLAVAVEHRLALVFAPRHALADQAHQPENAEDVVNVLVGDENGAYLPPVYLRPLQLPQQGVAPAAVHQKILPLLLQHEAGVVARRNGGVPRAQHGELHLHPLL